LTYENAVNWLIENMDLDDFDSYLDFWENGIQTEETFSDKMLSNQRFRGLLDRAVFKQKPEWRYGDLPPLPFEQPPTPRRRISRERTFATIEEKKTTFTTKEVYLLNPNKARPTIIRELQELVRQKRIERVSKGVYRNVS